MSLKALADEALARLRAGEMVHETEEETRVKQMKQAPACFTKSPSCLPPMKQDYPQKIAENGACFTVSSSRQETHETEGLPITVAAGLAKLRGQAAPRLKRPEVWPRVVADALRLADEGWAEQAMALGWSPLDLFGCSPDIGGNPDHDGLAVWIDGRRVLLLDDRTCIVATTATKRFVFNRREVAGAVLLWELGRG